MRQFEKIRVAICSILVGVIVPSALTQTFISDDPGLKDCTVRILNRTANVEPDGSWVLRNVPVGFGPQRARFYCKSADNTSATLVGDVNIQANRSITLTKGWAVNDLVLPPSSLELTLEGPSEAPVAVHVIAHYLDGTQRDVSD